MPNSKICQKTSTPVFWNYLFYGVTLLMAIALQAFYHYAANRELLCFLSPLTKVLEVFFGYKYYFQDEIGFYNLRNGVIIDKSCAGLNYFTILFSMFVFSFLSSFQRTAAKLSAFGVFFVLSYILTIAVNSLRVIAVVSFLAFDLTPGVISKEILHLSWGILYYLFFLLLIFHITSKIIGEGRLT